MTKTTRPERAMGAALLLAATAGDVAVRAGKTGEMPDRPYYLFRGCDDEHDEWGGGSSTGGTGGGGSSEKPDTGYMPYPDYPNRRRHLVKRRERRLGLEHKVDVWSGSSADRGDDWSGKADKARGSSSSGSSDGGDGSVEWSGGSGGGGSSSGGTLFAKCSKKTGKSTKSTKSSKSKSSKSSSGTSSKGGSTLTVWTAPTTPRPTMPTGPSAPYIAYTPRPTMKATPKPYVPIGQSKPVWTTKDLCDAVSDGVVKKSSYSATLTYVYEAAVSDDATVGDVNDDMGESLGKFVGRDLIGCDDRRRNLLEGFEISGFGGRRLGDLEVVGVDPWKPEDEVTGWKCKYLTGSKAVPDTACHVIKGGMTLYLRDEDDDEEPWRRERNLGTTSEDMEESTEDALELIMDKMNDDDPCPFLEECGGDYSVDGLMGVWFASGKTNEGEDVEAEDGYGGYGTKAAAQGGDDASTSSSKMTTVGGAILGVGLAALAALVLVAFVHKRKRDNAERYSQFKDDDVDVADDDLGTDVDAQSLNAAPSTPGSPRAYVVGEEGSLYTSATHDTRILHTSYEYGNDNSDDQQIDVHHCTSAMCPICNGKETVFVNALEEESVEPGMENYEFTYDPNTVSTSPKGSFEYEVKDSVSTPSFDNPAEIERPYVVDNTVDF